MKLKQLTALLLGLSSVAVFTSAIMSDNGKAGKTGSPSEGTCTDCHGDFALNSGGGAISIAGITGGTYIPGTTYNLSVTVARTGSTVYGLDVEALTAANANAGSFVITNSAQTQLKSVTVGGVSRSNVVHQLDGGFTTNTHTFNFNWTAPAAGTGNVKLYYTGIAGDHDGSESGDYVYNGSLALTEGGGCVTPAQPAVISGNTNVCAGSSQTYTIAAVTGATDYIWTLPGGWTGSSTSTSLPVTVGTSGGNITVAAHNACGTSMTRMITIGVNASVTPAVSIAANPGNTICTGTSVTFTATPTNGGTTPVYQWKLNGANVGTNSATYTNNALANGNIVSCVMTSNATCLSTTTATSNSITMSITTGLTPTVSIAANPGNTICTGTSVTFTATPTNGGTTPVYQWKLNGANVGTNSATYTNNALASGNIVSCVMTSNATCLSTTTATSNTITMAITTGLTPTVSIAANPGNTICAGTSVTFTATPTNGGTTPVYQWKLNGANVGTNSATYTNNALASGNIVSCIMTSNAACLSTTTATSNSITMAISTGLTPSVSIAANPGNTICTGTSVTFTATPTNGGTTPVYQWKLNGANVGTNSTTYTNNALANGNTVSCVMTSNSNCVSTSTATSQTITMVVNNGLVPTITAIGSTTFCQGGSVSLSASTGSSYVWSPNGQTTQSITVTNSGTYSVAVTSGGCSGSSATTTVTVNPLPVVTLASINPVCSNDPSFVLTGGSPTGGVYSGTAVSNGSFNPLTAVVGSNTITYTYTNSSNCTNSATTSVQVKNCSTGGCTDAPRMPGWIYGPYALVCGQSSVVYSVRLDTNATTYNWTVPSNAVITSQNANGNSITVKYLSNFTGGTICVSASNACGTSSSRCFNVFLRRMRISQIQGPWKICPNQLTATYSIPLVNGATNYKWTVSGGASITYTDNIAKIDFSSSHSSMVIIHVQVTNACGQVSDQSIYAQIYTNCDGHGGNNDGDDDDDDENDHHGNGHSYHNGRIATSISSFELFPNPANGSFTIQLVADQVSNAKITLIDMLGKVQLTLEQEVASGSNTIFINAEELNSGIYMVKLEIPGKADTIDRIVIQ